MPAVTWVFPWKNSPVQKGVLFYIYGNINSGLLQSTMEEKQKKSWVVSSDGSCGWSHSEKSSTYKNTNFIPKNFPERRHHSTGHGPVLADWSDPFEVQHNISYKWWMETNKQKQHKC